MPNGHPVGPVGIGGLLDQNMLVPEAACKQMRGQGRTSFDQHFHAARRANRFQGMVHVIGQVQGKAALSGSIQIVLGDPPPPVQKRGIPVPDPNYVTPAGARAARAELEQLTRDGVDADRAVGVSGSSRPPTS